MENIISEYWLPAFSPFSKCFQTLFYQGYLKLKEFADENFENGGKFSKRVENTVRKEKLVAYNQFLFSHVILKKNLHCRHIKARTCSRQGHCQFLISI